MKNWQRISQDSVLKNKLLTREKVFDGLRNFFKTQGFHEVETPLLVKHPGTEPYLEVFKTELVTPEKTQNAFLLTSPEYAMKKLIAGGMGDLFQICKSFRNHEGLSERHNPEFTILEWYRVNADYTKIMNDFEQLLLSLVEKIQNRTDGKITYQGKEYDISAPYTRISVAEAFEKYVGVTTDELLSVAALKKVAGSRGYQVDEETTWEGVYNQLFLNEIEPQLIDQNKPVIIYDYPASQAALSKKKDSDPRFAERFEIYLGGLELGNAFTELTDAVEQKARFEEELALRKQLGKTEYGLDQDYIDALASGLPPTGGIAVGVDRLVMLLADAQDINETIFFPAEEIFSS
ncbi:MAG: EF-P lysine aminoacylase GenX [Candidatus Pacebacteria bacterium CG10_big_fil_rev_8_21_14_0_10_36_11]|nr:EF-P lysine aminoacylase GenX [Candidatus Pacearchaeota archaeon]OIP74501.1 MAG: EF-P lysine aminoacylase GenX [Candidatus Pacebacteria bacterium CG2_30_36_39]PIR65126.1 MAG: EF-P lysine aminoacylase GenX [Candidatus Pacebacteria bacterium CG10_big_fil_rev_8_21_14_0_10_36_11]PJC43046.1 MAG: EF-P lysine aminoacylase GenX [Candidatus Pacebacteria bacterium CG_4_9_14_0_2_um_filter_36_8]